MLIKVICVGRLKDRALNSRCEEFIKWLSPYSRIELAELPDSNVAKEGAAILRALERDRDAVVFAMAEEGREYSSVEFSEMLGGIDRKTVFVIGGPFGLDASVKKRADRLISLSRMTFTHELARLLLLEQLFRADSIRRGGGYHNP